MYLLLLAQCLVWLSRHTHRSVTNQPKYGQIINCGLTILIVSVFLCRLRITTQLRSDSWHCWQTGRYFYKTHLATLPRMLFTRNLNKKASKVETKSGQIWKKLPKWANVHKNTSKLRSAENRNRENSIKYGKQSAKQNLQKSSPKTSKL